MDQTKINKIVSEWIKDGIYISQETVEYLIWYCNKKMDVYGIENREEYLPLLFRDELKSYLFKKYVNVTTLLKMQKGKCGECVTCV